jgi:hypothetical protein
MTRSFARVVNYLSGCGSASSPDGVRSGLRPRAKTQGSPVEDLGFEPQLSPEQAKRAAGGSLEHVIGSCRRGDLNPHGLCAH